MSSSSESEPHSPQLSHTSVAESMVSMNTEDHNELYDHRQHISVPPRLGQDSPGSSNLNARHMMLDDRANEDFGFMNIEGQTLIASHWGRTTTN